MLKSIRIKNSRSFEDATIRLDAPVIAMIGKNGVGKTSLLHSIQLAAELCIGAQEPISGLHPRSSDEPVTFELEFRVGDSVYSYATTRRENSAAPSDLAESLTRDGQPVFERRGERVTTQIPKMESMNLGIGASTLASLLTLLPGDSSERNELNSVASYLKEVQYYPLTQGFHEHLERPVQGAAEVVRSSSSFIEFATYDRWKAGLSLGRVPRSVQMRLLHMSLSDPESFAELKDLVGDERGIGLISDIRIETIISSSSNPKAKVSNRGTDTFRIWFKPGIEMAGAGTEFTYSDLSAGTWRVLELFTYLVFDKNSCMLLEQPEDSIHPGLLEKVMGVLEAYSDRTQLICTTHSPKVISLLQPESLRFVVAEKGISTVRAMTEREVQVAAEYLEEKGTLGEFVEML